MTDRTRRLIFFFIAIAAGTALGIALGWGVFPAKSADTSPRTLRIDFKTDYVLMVAELYQIDGDIALAVERLSYIDETDPVGLVNQAVDYAQEHTYAPEDLQLMLTLSSSVNSLLAQSG